ncbi:MAG: hypothetical protein JW837_04875 [Sedimentisphaerales bacterium]|nr:hypothetical protein [Sedimentisphaerales bacterium]
MIVVKTPFRVSFAGGGSDIDTFYRKTYGAVVSTTINKFMYLMIHPYFHDKIRIKYSRTEDAESINEIRHPLVRECLKLMKIGKGVEIASIADVPAGTGLGSSSAFTVGLLQALSVYKQKIRTKEWLAKTACQIEIEKVGEPIGKQDQYACSLGGLNYIRFNPDKTVLVEPIILKHKIKQKLEANLLMFYVGNERKTSHILSRQKKALKNTQKFMFVSKMVEIAEEIRQTLIRGQLEKFGELLHQGWLLKKRLTEGITNHQLDYYYGKALKAGAIGGKLLGAGGGGFLLFYCEKRYQNQLITALKLRELDFKFDNEGVKVIYFDKP